MQSSGASNQTTEETVIWLAEILHLLNKCFRFRALDAVGLRCAADGNPSCVKSADSMRGGPAGEKQPRRSVGPMASRSTRALKSNALNVAALSSRAAFAPSGAHRVELRSGALEQGRADRINAGLRGTPSWAAQKPSADAAVLSS